MNCFMNFVSKYTPIFHWCIMENINRLYFKEKKIKLRYCLAVNKISIRKNYLKIICNTAILIVLFIMQRLPSKHKWEMIWGQGFFTAWYNQQKVKLTQPVTYMYCTVHVQCTCSSYRHIPTVYAVLTDL